MVIVCHLVKVSFFPPRRLLSFPPTPGDGCAKTEEMNRRDSEGGRLHSLITMPHFLFSFLHNKVFHNLPDCQGTAVALLCCIYLPDTFSSSSSPWRPVRPRASSPSSRGLGAGAEAEEASATASGSFVGGFLP